MEEFFVVAFVVLVFAGFFTFVFQMSEATSHDDCHDRGELAQVQVTYRKWDGCYVYYGSAWMPYDVWKYNRDHGVIVK